MKLKNLLTTMALAVTFLFTGSMGWAQTKASLVSETVIYSTGFESSEGFTAGSTYNNTTVAYTGPADKQWGTYYGTPATTGAIAGTQSMQMRWYTSAVSNLGYTFTNFDLPNVTKVEFYAANLNVNVTVSYSTDGGVNYVGDQTYTLTATSTPYTYTVSTTGEYESVRIRFKIAYETAPTATSRLYIDDVKVYGIDTPPSLKTSSLVPADNSTDILTNTTLTIPFNEDIQKGTGNINIYKVSNDATPAQVIDVTTTAVAVSGSTATVTLANELENSTEYYVNIDAGAFKDATNNNFAGLTDKTTWTFTTIGATTPTLTLTTPNGGEKYSAGDQATITWTFTNIDAAETIIIEVAPDGTTYQTLGTSTNDGTETVTIPASFAYATTYKVKVSYNTASDESDAAFTVFPVLTSIHDIQYTTDATGNSPYKDQVIRTKGLVTGVKGSSYYNYHIQDGTGSWSGVYVYGNSTAVAVGDSIDIVATVAEYNSLTELKSIASLTILNSGNAAPTPVSLSIADAGSEAYEGVLVSISNAQCTVAPDEYKAWTVSNGTNTILVDDFYYNYTPTVGSRYNITGVIDYNYNLFRIYPRSEADVSINNSAPSKPMNNLKIYPNPFSNEIKFDAANITRVTVTSVIGQVVIDQAITSQNSVNTEELSAGIYLVKFTNNKGESTLRKLVKE